MPTEEGCSIQNLRVQKRKRRKFQVKYFVGAIWHKKLWGPPKSPDRLPHWRWSVRHLAERMLPTVTCWQRFNIRVRGTYETSQIVDDEVRQHLNITKPHYVKPNYVARKVYNIYISIITSEVNKRCLAQPPSPASAAAFPCSLPPDFLTGDPVFCC